VPETERKPGLFSALRRRRVITVAGAYLAVGWLITEIAGFLLEQAGAPAWSVRLLAIAFVVGFPVAVTLAWTIRRGPGRAWAIDSSSGQTRNVIGALALGVAATAGLSWLIIPGMEPPAELSDYRPLPRSIAILPFANDDETPHSRTVADTLYTALVEGLNQAPDLTRVRLRLEQRPRDPIALGRSVRVAALLVGRVKHAAGRTRVELQLWDVARDRIRWAHTLDWDQTGVMDAGANIANGVLEAMGLPPVTRQRFAGTDDLDAYEAFLLGGRHRASFKSAMLAMAMDDYERAIEHDPGYVLAHVALAETIGAYIWVSGPPEEQRKALRERAQAAMQTAAAIDDRSAAVISLLGQYARGREVRIQAFRHALEVDPGHAPSYFRLGKAMWASEDREEAMRLIRKALELDPLNARYHNDLGNVLWMLQRDEEAAAEFRRSIELEPGLAFNYMNLGAIEHLHFGRLDEAVVNYRRAHALDPGGGWSAANLAYTYAYLGGEEEALAWLENSLETSPTKSWAWAMAAVVQERVGRHEAALESARRLLELKPNDEIGLYLLAAHDIAEGRAARAVERWETAYPMFAIGETSELTFRDFEALLMFSTNLMEAGEGTRARRLLRDCQGYLDNATRRDESYMLYPWIQSLLGRKEGTLTALRYAVEERNVRDEGLLFEPWHFDFLRDEPEFQRLVTLVKTDLARQLQRVREMERAGELPPGPGAGM